MKPPTEQPLRCRTGRRVTSLFSEIRADVVGLPAPSIADHARRIAKSPFVGGKWIDPDMRLDSWRAAQQRGGHLFLLRPDGSATELAPGTNGHETVPGESVIFMWAGAARATIARHGTIKETEQRLHHGQLQQPVRAPRRLIVAQLESRASA